MWNERRAGIERWLRQPHYCQRRWPRHCSQINVLLKWMLKCVRDKNKLNGKLIVTIVIFSHIVVFNYFQFCTIRGNRTLFSDCDYQNCNSCLIIQFEWIELDVKPANRIKSDSISSSTFWPVIKTIQHSILSTQYIL